MSTDTSEAGLESLITEYLVRHNRYTFGTPKITTKAYCLDRAAVARLPGSHPSRQTGKNPPTTTSSCNDSATRYGTKALWKCCVKASNTSSIVSPSTIHNPPNNLNPAAVQKLSGQSLFRHAAGAFQPATPRSIAGYGHLPQRPAALSPLN